MDRKRQIAIVAGLLALGCLVQAALIRRATVPALDAVRFVELAQRIDAQGLVATLRHQREQPLFPAWVWLVHGGVESVAGPQRSSWAMSVQLAAAIPLVLAIVPVYFVCLRLVGPTAALAGALLFSVLPEVSRLGADGLGDSTHLCFFCLALWAVLAYLGAGGRQPNRVQGSRHERVQGSGFRVQEEASRGDSVEARDRSKPVDDRVGPPPLPCPVLRTGRDPRWLLVAGMLIALAVLVRAEGLVLPGAVVIALAAFQLRSRYRQSWPRLAAAFGCLAIGCGIVFLPYLVAVGATAPRAAIARILGRGEPPEEVEALGPTPTAAALQADGWRLADDEPMSFATKETTISLRRRGYVAAGVQLADELADAFSYVVGALALFGLWRLRRRLVRPEDWFAQLYCLLFSLVLLHFAAKEGYVSARHLLTLVVLGTGFAGYGALDLGRSIALWTRLGSRDPAASECRKPVTPYGPVLAWTVVLLAGVVCLSEAVEPLHASREGHRLAGEWLAKQGDSPGPILDTRGWTGLYSGRTTYRYDRAAAAFGDPQLAYVVLERRELDYGSRRSRTLEHLLNVAGQRVAVFPGPQPSASGQGAVLIYRWLPERFTRWVARQNAAKNATTTNPRRPPCTSTRARSSRA